MKDITVSDLEIMNEAKNYQTWIYNQIKPYLGHRILEVGAGIGNLTEYVYPRELIVAIDVHAGCIRYLKNKFSAYRALEFFQLDIAQPDILQLKKYTFDTIICINVLEHIEDDLTALHNMYKLLGKHGVLILFVPAFDLLFGTVDRSLGHIRRYNKKSLHKLLSQTKLRHIKTAYSNFIGILGWFLNNKILHRQEESKKQILFFDRRILPITSKIEEKIHLPFGLSLLSIWQK